MRAVNGYLENGRFTPLEAIKLPKHVSAVLVFNEISVDDEKAERMAWLRKFDNAVDEAAGEEMPDFPRARFNRELIDLSDEG